VPHGAFRNTSANKRVSWILPQDNTTTPELQQQLQLQQQLHLQQQQLQQQQLRGTTFNDINYSWRQQLHEFPVTVERQKPHEMEQQQEQQEQVRMLLHYPSIHSSNSMLLPPRQTSERRGEGEGERDGDQQLHQDDVEPQSSSALNTTPTRRHTHTYE
jgi:hypothetical protein